jgi:hypothetical protein
VWEGWGEGAGPDALNGWGRGEVAHRTPEKQKRPKGRFEGASRFLLMLF